jgi:hypothetical protein
VSAPGLPDAGECARAARFRHEPSRRRFVRSRLDAISVAASRWNGPVEDRLGLAPGVCVVTDLHLGDGYVGAVARIPGARRLRRPTPTEPQGGPL